MTTSYNEMDSFSSSYSMLTSHVPSFDGDGQQLTIHKMSLPNQRVREDTYSRAEHRFRPFLSIST